MYRRRAMRLVNRIHRVQHIQAQRIERELHLFFMEQARRVTARFLADGHKTLMVKVATADRLMPTSEYDALRQLLIRLLSSMVIVSSDLASDLAGVPRLHPADPKLLALLAKAAHRAVSITDETRGAIQGVLTLGASRGYSDYQVANGVPKDDFRGLRATVSESYRGRAENIARTETAIASQQAAHMRYRDAGVLLVDIMDGEGCGWTEHDDPDVADGSTRTIEQAEEYPISHPRCRRISLPNLESRR